MGPFGMSFHNITFEGKIMYVVVPQGEGRSGPWPTLIYMHGWTGAWEQQAFLPGQKPNASTWYARPLDIYASHGFAIVFPFVIGPIADLNRSSLETNASSIYKALDFVRASQKDESSPFKGLLDEKNMAIGGHSMGSGDTILAGNELPAGTVKFLAIQHPASYIMESQGFANADKKFPLVLTTATNDCAFFPAPETAAHDLEQFNKSNATVPAAFLQFSNASCQDTNKSRPWDDKGHQCSFKPNVEAPWILRGLKTFLHFNGDVHSQCGRMLFGSGPDAPAQDPHIDKAIVLNPPQLTIV